MIAKDEAMINIAIVDDHHVVADGFSRLINLQADLNVDAIASSYEEAIEYLSQNSPHLMIIDVSLKGKSGIELVNHVHKHHPEIKLITLSMYDTEPYISDALNSGASGYLSKQVATTELITAIHQVMNDQEYISEDIAHNREEDLENQKSLHLTDREKEVFILLAKGKLVKTIASELGMQPKTVHAHKANIVDKLNVKTSEEMRKMALSYNLLSVDDLL